MIKKYLLKSLAEQGYSKIKILILMGATKFKIKAAFDEFAKRKW